MNFLAHLYLSDSNTKLMTGNFIADHIHGNRFTHFDPEIQKGIFLHRHIDTFTDEHLIVRKSKRRLHARYGHYRGIIIDIFYDHFLAKNWHEYSAIPLDLFVQGVYDLLERQNDDLPKKTQDLLPFMIQYDWLYNYQFFGGIQKVLNGMNKRTHLQSQMHLALEDLQIHYIEFEKDFRLFFEDLRTFTKENIIQLNQTSNFS